MDRNYGIEIDELKKDIAEIKELLTLRKEPNRGKSGGWSPESEKSIEEVKDMAARTGNNLGAIFYKGFFESAGREAKWKLVDGINDLMEMPQDKLSVVLSSLGNQQRWEILCALLKKPMTVAQIVEMFDMKTSGKAYHHLNNLIAADLLEEDKNAEKGTYAVKGHRVSGIILIMTGVHQLTDARYSNGEWGVD
jgi:DNA-binding transcriptional ArsR family regulator